MSKPPIFLARYDPRVLLSEESIYQVQLEQGREKTPGEKLSLALLSDVAFILSHEERDPEQYQADWEWLHANSEEPCSFVWACRAIHAHPEWMRKALVRLLESGWKFNKTKDREMQKLRHGIQIREYWNQA